MVVNSGAPSHCRCRSSIRWFVCDAFAGAQSACGLNANLRAKFAELADKSRQQIYRDILACRLLSLNVGPRGPKLPEWQLDSVKQRLTKTVLQEVEGTDHWKICRAPSEPLEGLGGRSPVNAVTHGTIDEVAEVVFNVLGVQLH